MPSVCYVYRPYINRQQALLYLYTCTCTCTHVGSGSSISKPKRDTATKSLRQSHQEPQRGLPPKWVTIQSLCSGLYTYAPALCSHCTTSYCIVCPTLCSHCTTSYCTVCPTLGDCWRVVLKGESVDYIHAVVVNVSRQCAVLACQHYPIRMRFMVYYICYVM